MYKKNKHNVPAPQNMDQTLNISHYSIETLTSDNTQYPEAKRLPNLVAPVHPHHHRSGQLGCAPDTSGLLYPGLRIRPYDLLKIGNEEYGSKLSVPSELFDKMRIFLYHSILDKKRMFI